MWYWMWLLNSVNMRIQKEYPRTRGLFWVFTSARVSTPNIGKIKKVYLERFCHTNKKENPVLGSIYLLPFFFLRLFATSCLYSTRVSVIRFNRTPFVRYLLSISKLLPPLTIDVKHGKFSTPLFSSSIK